DFDLKAGPPNWQRFWALATKVRALKHNDGKKGGTTESPTQLSGRISPNAISHLLLHQSWGARQFLLPKLARLEWIATWEHSLLQVSYFLSPMLRDLVIDIGKSLSPDLAIRNLERLASLPPMNVTTLIIKMHYPESDSDLQLAPTIASFAESQPTLQSLDFGYMWSPGEVVKSLIQHANLTSLELLLHLDTLSELRSLLELLAHQCPRMSRFTYGLPESFPLLTPRDAMEPLLSCRLLVQFEIFHPSGLPVGSDDIKRMAKAWREMEVLRLCANTADSIQVGTPLVLLLEFAEEFSPRLRQLALNFVFDVELPKANVVWTSFPNLEILGVGTSKPETTAQAIVIGEFLACVCSEHTELAYIWRNEWRNKAFDTTSWKGAPEASHWVEVVAVMDCGRRIQEATLAKAFRVKEAKRT
ncbi:hypothetical protein FRC01_008742, partial [Tulasnella sp. 417]